MTMNSIHIPKELVLEIFKKLPVKSLCRFMCLSHSYCSSIKEIVKDVEEHRPPTPFRWVYFNKEYYNIEEEYIVIPSVYLDSMEHTLEHIRLGMDIGPYEFDKNYYVRYCNGLICALMDGRICIFNLTTLETILLPGGCDEFEICYDPRLRKYKVLGWKNKTCWGWRDSEFWVLTVERGCSWRPIGSNDERMEWMELSFFFFLQDREVMKLSSTAAFGKLFWADQELKRIISFDIAEERWFQLGLPDELNQLGQNDYDFLLFEMENYLGLVEQRRDDAPMFNMWVLKDCENENGWIKLRSNISLPLEDNYLEMIDEKRFVRERYSQFSYCNGEVVILVDVVVDDDTVDELYVFLYNLATGNSKSVLITRRNQSTRLMVDNYIENNISLSDLIE